MPALGADMESATLIEWSVKVGDRVRRGDIVAVVETDKGAIEIEIFDDAIIAELLVTPDTEVAVGTPLARLTAIDDQSVSEPVPVPPAAPVAETPAPVAPRAVMKDRPVARSSAPPLRPTPATAQPAASSTRRKISPAARLHARERGIDLDSVVGTGAGGVVTLADVEQFARSTQPMVPQPAAERTPGGQTRAMRRAIAMTMARSKREIPHYYLAHAIDVEPALAWLERRNAQRPVEQRIVYGALFLKAVARAAAETPSLNGHWRDGGFEGSQAVNVGVVISLRGGGLAAPALNDADALDIDALMAALKDATARARRGRLKSSELSSATITVSSLGDSGVETMFPIIHPPQVAIVGFGAVMTRPWVVDGGLYVRRVVTATLAADHRASDGHEGARLLSALARHLAKPEAL